MSGKEIGKLATVGVILAIAAVIWVSRRGEAGSDGEDKTFWYCTKTKKVFEIAGKDYANNVRQARRAASGESGDGSGRMQRTPEANITIAKIPYTGEWTGVPTMKCGGCGEIFPAVSEGRKEIMCPKCSWNPQTNKKGPSHTEEATDDKE
jgi:hypothetical protein